VTLRCINHKVPGGCKELKLTQYTKGEVQYTKEVLHARNFF